MIEIRRHETYIFTTGIMAHSVGTNVRVPQMRFAILIAIIAATFSCVDRAQASTDRKLDPQISKMAREYYKEKDDKEAYRAAIALLEKPAPPLTLHGWRGQPVDLSKAKGKIVVIDFWATWCQPCIRQIPQDNQILSKYASKCVLVIGACSPRGSQTMTKVAEQNKMLYATAKMLTRDIAPWTIDFWPTIAIIDRDGRVRALGLQPEHIGDVLDQLLIEQPPEK